MKELRQVEILECSLRDGSYAIDFNFTSADTELLVEKLTGIGFNWIEIGHGLGMGAELVGKGEMPNNDLALLKAARQCTSANIGMFYLPELSSKKQLVAAADNGLDFVRIGANATEAESAFSHLTYAKSLGLTVGMNFMKSYAISADEFGVLSKQAVEAGADIIYLVDSVGGMTPAEVEQYLSATKKNCKCELGFHGHDNLKMAVANTLKAHECGARFLDATIMGIGRGAGNAASEALACLLEDSGIPTGVDIGSLLKLADTYVWPLLSNLTMYSTQEVAMGYGKFHSSHLPKVKSASKKYNADLKELIIKMGRIDPVDIDDRTLEQTALEMKNTQSDFESLALTSYPGLKDLQDKISLNDDAVTELIKGIAVTCAKRRKSTPVLELEIIDSGSDELLVAEHIWDSERVVVGRITAGNVSKIISMVEFLAGSPFHFVVNPRKSALSEDEITLLRSKLGYHNVFSVDTGQLKKNYIFNALTYLGNQLENKSIMIFGEGEQLKSHLLQFSSFEQIIVVDKDAGDSETSSTITNIDDWALLDMKVDIIYTTMIPDTRTEEKLQKCLGPKSRLISPFASHADNRAYYLLNLDAAYEGIKEYIEVPDFTIQGAED